MKIRFAFRKLWDRRPGLTLARFVAVVVLTAILSAGVTAGYFATTEIKKQKLRDTWAILFLDMEKLGQDLVRDLKVGDLVTRPPAVTFEIDQKANLQVLSGDFPEGLSAKDLGIQTFSQSSGLDFVSFAGTVYVMRQLEHSGSLNVAPHLGLWPFPMTSAIQVIMESHSTTTLYILNRSGTLIYSNDETITAEKVTNRPLVQSFIRMPMWQSQQLFKNAAGEPIYGFFQEVRGTNLVLFAEISEQSVLAPVRAAALRFLAILAVIAVMALVLLIVPLNAVSRPLGSLVSMARQVGEGNFDGVVVHGGFGELKALTKSFMSMAANLKQRDVRIQLLLREEAQQIRLKAELELARQIQQNFLQRPLLPVSSKVQLSSLYVPAGEVAGDWFGYDHDPATGVTIVALADVSGHGTGSCLFTAVIAGLFGNFVRNSRGIYSMEDFAKSLDFSLRELGQGNWHATFIMAKIDECRREVSFLNAGHCFPMVIEGEPLYEAKEIRVPVIKALKLPSTPLGLGDLPDFATTTLTLTRKTKLLLYTDGLTESLSPSGKAFGNKKLRAVCHANQTENVDALIAAVHEDWKNHLAGGASQDDICLVGIKCA